eukprot:3936175-Rhodomonas_salina.1
MGTGYTHSVHCLPAPGWDWIGLYSECAFGGRGSLFGAWLSYPWTSRADDRGFLARMSTEGGQHSISRHHLVFTSSFESNSLDLGADLSQNREGARTCRNSCRVTGYPYPETPGPAMPRTGYPVLSGTCVPGNAGRNSYSSRGFRFDQSHNQKGEC